MTKNYGPWAVITGASDGIGRAIAGRAAAEGINVALVARSESKLRELAVELQRTGGVETRVIAVDLGKSASVTTLLDAVADLDVGLALSLIHI
ncbi:MAG: SDR family NAD(P)-dependent oxidoreductase, partial [Mycobacterium sp.]|nr:SDR family NAD(P)-dependent oxidoreductase [Mycobacterium sp.]